MLIQTQKAINSSRHSCRLKTKSAPRGKPPQGIDGKVETSLPQGREKGHEPRYPGRAIDDEDVPTAAYHAATISGSCISKENSIASGPFENGKSNS